MSLLLKFSGLLLIVSTIGVLHSAASQYLMQPDVEKNTMYNEQRLEGQTNNNSSTTESSSPAVFVDSINDVEQGSLFTCVSHQKIAIPVTSIMSAKTSRLGAIN
ncbi:hypothetical protein P4S73_24815 [Paraglaciecola sp. Hal342]